MAAAPVALQQGEFDEEVPSPTPAAAPVSLSAGEFEEAPAQAPAPQNTALDKFQGQQKADIASRPLITPPPVSTPIPGFPAKAPQSPVNQAIEQTSGPNYQMQSNAPAPTNIGEQVKSFQAGSHIVPVERDEVENLPAHPAVDMKESKLAPSTPGLDISGKNYDAPFQMATGAVKDLATGSQEALGDIGEPFNKKQTIEGITKAISGGSKIGIALSAPELMDLAAAADGGNIAAQSSIVKLLATAEAGNAASDIGGRILDKQPNVSPETKELIRTGLFFLPTLIGTTIAKAGVRGGIGVDTEGNPAAGVSSPEGSVRAGVRGTPTAYEANVAVGSSRFGVKVPRPQPVPDAAQIQAGEQQAAATATASKAAIIDKAAADKVNGVPPPPPPPQPAKPTGMDQATLTQATVQNAAEIIKAIPADKQAGAMLEAHSNLAKWMMNTGRFVGPDGKLQVADSPVKADKLAQDVLNAEVDRQKSVDEEKVKQQQVVQKEQEKQKAEAEKAAAEPNENGLTPQEQIDARVKTILEASPTITSHAEQVATVAKHLAIDTPTASKLVSAAVANQQATVGNGADATTEESRATIDAQIGALARGDIHTVMLPEGSKYMPQVPKGAKVVKVTGDVPGAGTYITTLRAATVKEAAKAGTHGDLLGHIETKESLADDKPQVVVQAKTPEGTVIQDSQVHADPELVGRQAEILHERHPEATISVAHPNDVIKERQAAVETEAKAPEPVELQAGEFEQPNEVAKSGEAEDKLAENRTEQEAAVTPNVAAAPKPEETTKYDFGSTQSNIPAKSEAGQALAAARERIDREDLAPTEYGGDEKGLETEPHVTVRYGIQGDDTAGIEKYLKSQAPFWATLGKSSSFPPSKSSDGGAVIKADVEAPELHRMNAEVDKHGDFKESDFPDYKPHATIAYVKPEAVEKYVGMTETEGKRFRIDHVAISDRNGDLKEIKLEGKPASNEVEKPEVTPVKKGDTVTFKDRKGTERTGTVAHADGRIARIKSEGKEYTVPAKKATKVSAEVEKQEQPKGGEEIKQFDVAIANTGADVVEGKVSKSDPEQIAGWKSKINRLRARISTTHHADLGELRDEIGVLEDNLRRVEFADRVDKAHKLTPPDDAELKAKYSGADYQKEYFKSALQQVKDAGIERIDKKGTGKETWDWLAEQENRPVGEFEDYPEAQLYIHVPDDGHFLIHNTPYAIEKALKGANKGFAKVKATKEGGGAVTKPRAPKEFEPEKYIAQLEKQEAEAKDDLKKNADTMQRGYYEEQLKAVQQNLAEAKSGGAPPAERPEPAKPAAEPKKSKLTKLAEEQAAKLAEHFTPGNVIHSNYWRDHDKVVSFTPTTEGKGWSVGVIKSDKEGNPVPGERERTHSTFPDKRDVIVKRAQQEGDGVTLRSSLFGVDILAKFMADTGVKFYEKDIQPSLEKLGPTLTKAGRSATDILYPRSGANEDALDSLMKAKGDREEHRVMLENIDKGLDTFFDKMPLDAQIAFMDRAKQGVSQLGKDATETQKLDEIRALMEDLNDESTKRMLQYKPSMALRDHYYGMIWKTIPDATGKHAAANAARAKNGFTGQGKRPFEGAKGFMKQSTLENITEGINMGGEPITHNPWKMFRLVEAQKMQYITAQDHWKRLKELGLRKFIRPGKPRPDGWVKLEDRIAKVFFPAEVLTKDLDDLPSWTRGKGGYKHELIAKEDVETRQAFIPMGEWYLEPSAGRLLNNYLSRDLIRENAIGNFLMLAKNMSTGLELSLSPFHLLFESLEAMGSQLGLGVQRFWNTGVREGSATEAAKGLGDAAGFMAAPFLIARSGGSMMKMIQSPQDFANTKRGLAFLKKYPNAPALLGDLYDGGLTWGMNADYRTDPVKSLRESAKEGNYVGTVLRALPALNQTIMHPLFGVLIPRLKWGLALAQLSQQYAEEADALANGTTTREKIARQVVDTVENRLGELNFSNLFWNNTFKSIMQFIFRSVTWKLGNWRGLGTALGPEAKAAFADPLKAMYEDVRGGNKTHQTKDYIPRMGPNQAWLFGMIAMTTMLGTIYAKLVAGKYPWEHAKEDAHAGYSEVGAWLLESIHPRTGKVNKVTGKPERVSLPTGLKDFEHAAHDPKQYVNSSLSSTVGRFVDISENRDFFGNYVYDPNASYYRKAAEIFSYAVPRPIGLENWNSEFGSQDVASKALRFAGFNASSSQGLDNSPAEQRMVDKAKAAHTPKTPEQVDAYRERNTTAKPTVAQMRSLIKHGNKEHVQQQFEKMGYADARDVYNNYASPREKAILKDILDAKRLRALRKDVKQGTDKVAQADAN